MSVISSDQPATAASSAVPTRGYWRRPHDEPRPHRFAPLPLRSSGQLQVGITLGGDTYAQRHQAKAAGYHWVQGQWHRLLSVAVQGNRPRGHLGGLAQLNALIAQDAALFSVWSAGDVTYLPDAVPLQLNSVDVGSPLPPPVTRLVSDLPIRLVTNLEALVTVLRRSPLVVLEKQPPLSSRILAREPRSGWYAAVSMLDTGMRYQLRHMVLTAARADGRIQQEPVWQPSAEANRWVPVHAMTPQQLDASQAGQVTLGLHLSLS